MSRPLKTSWGSESEGVSREGGREGWWSASPCQLLGVWREVKDGEGEGEGV